MLRLAVQSRRLAIRKGNLYPHLFHTFSDFAFLALCTNLRPSFLAYQIEANIVMPLEGIHNEAAAQTTSHLGSETNGIRLELSLAGCCFLSSSHAGQLREMVGGGRELGGQERQSCLASLQVYLHPASRRSGRGGRCLPSQLTRTQPVS